MNEIEKTINRLKRMLHHNESQQACDAINAAISALEKQIPKKVIFKASKYIPYEKYSCCSNCDYPLGIDAEPDYCYDCGQKLDWSVGE